VQPKRKPRRAINHHDFIRDLVRGAVGEDIVEAFLKEEFGLLPHNVSTKNSDYDLLVDKIDPALKKRNVVEAKLLKKILREAFDVRRDKMSVEVKYDEAAARYKNIFVELFFDINTGVPGTIFKCTSDIIAWVIPARAKRYKIYLLKRPAFLAWLFEYIYTNREIKLKTPAISPLARGIAVPITAVEDSFACLGVWDFTWRKD